jgi:Spy/CpxP family protein refolding chaperone
MQLLSLSRAALLASVFSVAGLTAVVADDQSNNPPPPDNGGGAPDNGGGGGPGGGGKHGGGLTPDQRAELKKDHDQVLAANPDLQKEEDDLKAKRGTMSSATPEEQAALKTEMHDHEKKMHDAILQIDPAAAPLLAKMHGHHGPPPGGGQGGGNGGGGDAGSGSGTAQ